jgi:para-aminobenzoate synthetase component I
MNFDPVHLSDLISLEDWGGYVCVLHGGSDHSTTYIGLGSEDQFVSHGQHTHCLEKFQSWLDTRDHWAFGILGYDLKNETEPALGQPEKPTSFPSLIFFRPRLVISIRDQKAEILYNKTGHPDVELLNLLSRRKDLPPRKAESVTLNPEISRERYLEIVDRIQHHIHLGDVYEINYCQRFSARTRLTDPYHTWVRLYSATKAPMSAFFQSGERYLLCASPERFLQRRKNKLISQPIKGTIKRGVSEEEDHSLRLSLLKSKKERSENVMIVDLVRNDLSRSAKRGSVRVEELFGIHTFPTVHHLISTISSEIARDLPFTQILRDTFPMGSMTGAPKVRAMQLIDHYEEKPREWYSGAVGYIRPGGDFDFNVIIRSVVVDNARGEISCSVGSAITSLSKGSEEYEECLLKLFAIQEVLGT